MECFAEFFNKVLRPGDLGLILAKFYMISEEIYAFAKIDLIVIPYPDAFMYNHDTVTKKLLPHSHSISCNMQSLRDALELICLDSNFNSMRGMRILRARLAGTAQLFATSTGLKTNRPVMTLSNR